MIFPKKPLLLAALIASANAFAFSPFNVAVDNESGQKLEAVIVYHQLKWWSNDKIIINDSSAVTNINNGQVALFQNKFWTGWTWYYDDWAATIRLANGQFYTSDNVTAEAPHMTRCVVMPGDLTHSPSVTIDIGPHGSDTDDPDYFDGHIAKAFSGPACNFRFVPGAGALVHGYSQGVLSTY